MSCLRLLISCLLAGAAWAQDPSGAAAAQEASAAIVRGDFEGAERRLRAASGSGAPWIFSLLGVALDRQGKLREAADEHARAVALLPDSADILNNYGSHLWLAGNYGEAEGVFSKSLLLAPGAFNILYNLGVMATLAGHSARACEALEAALRQQPQNVEVLYRLAVAEEATRRFESAVEHLAKAAKLDPRRADVQKMLALTAMELGALEDAAVAWDRYLAIQPGDDAARRERGFNLAKMGQLEKGVADIQWYLARHPDDPVAHFELGQAERNRDVEKAARAIDRALSLRPRYPAALSARGTLFYQQGKAEDAVRDLEQAALLEPDDAVNLDRLGQAYATLERGQDAVRVLRQAAALAPGDSKVLLHLGRALADAGMTEESNAVMNRFRELGPEKKANVPAGFVAYLSMSPEQRLEDYRKRVEKAVLDHPEDAAARLEAMKVALDEGQMDRAAATARKMLELKPGAAVLAAAGRALLRARQLALARQMLERTQKAGTEDVAVDLARLRMYEVEGRRQELLGAVEQVVGIARDRPEIYVEAVGLLMRSGQAGQGLRLVSAAPAEVLANRDVTLLRAAALELAGKTANADRALEEVAAKWPEWAQLWAVRGVAMVSRGRVAEGRTALEIAERLGARGPTVGAALGRSRQGGVPGAKTKARSSADEPAYLSSLYRGH